VFLSRSVARASHENAAAKKASPVATTGTRAARPAARSNPEPQPKAANISQKAVKKSKVSAEDAAEEPDFEDILPELQADDEESADDDGSGEDEFTSQRLVVRLTPKQEKKLEEGLGKINTAAKSKASPSPATKSSGEHCKYMPQCDFPRHNDF
jgi:hypothetical protein